MDNPEIMISIPDGSAIFDDQAPEFSTEGPFGPAMSTKDSGPADAKGKRKKSSEK